MHFSKAKTVVSDNTFVYLNYIKYALMCNSMLLCHALMSSSYRLALILISTVIIPLLHQSLILTS